MALAAWSLFAAAWLLGRVRDHARPLVELRPDLRSRTLTLTAADTYALDPGESADVRVETVLPCADDPAWVQVVGWWAGPDGDARLTVEVRTAALPAPDTADAATGGVR